MIELLIGLGIVARVLLLTWLGRTARRHEKTTCRANRSGHSLSIVDNNVKGGACFVAKSALTNRSFPSSVDKYLEQTKAVASTWDLWRAFR